MPSSPLARTVPATDHPPSSPARHALPARSLTPAASRWTRARGHLALGAVAVGAASVALPLTEAVETAGALELATQEIADRVVDPEALGRVPDARPPTDDAARADVTTVAASQGPRSGAGAGALRKARKLEERSAARRVAEGPARSAVRNAGGRFASPVNGRVTSGYGARSGGQHYGLDVANRIGTPIRSAAAGTVISAGPASGFGLWVRVRHGDGTVTVYGHINKALVEVGQRVGAGEVIAEVGNRGQSTGPHLHFEAHSSGGTKLDPGRWLDQRGVGF